MGKVHRIKKAFWHIVSQHPMPEGNHHLAHTRACIYVGHHTRDNSQFVIQFSSDHAYKSLITQLIKAYEGGGSSSD